MENLFSLLVLAGGTVNAAGAITRAAAISAFRAHEAFLGDPLIQFHSPPLSAPRRPCETEI